MNKIKIFLAGMVAMAAVCACSSDDDNVVVVPTETTSSDTVHVAVVLPQYILEDWQNSIEYALKNIAKAQQLEQHKVVLKLHFYDEETENLDKLAFRLVMPEKGDDSISAIVGPYHSYNAQVFLNFAAQKRLPVVMPTCTSAELQRIHARNTYAWFLTESDITQCEIMLQAVKAMKATHVALLYSDDTYGRSFYDWFGYWAVELGLKVAGGVGTSFKHGDNLENFYKNVADEAGDEPTVVCMALSSPADFLDASIQFKDFDDKYPSNYMKPLFTDVAMTKEIINSSEDIYKFGLSPYGSVNYGYPQQYKNLFSEASSSGDAQVYDALMIIALGRALQYTHPDECIVDGKPVVYDTTPYEPGLTDYMRSVVSYEEGEHTTWTDAGLALAFHELYAGRPIDCEGATGELIFDQTTRTKITNTPYMVWTTEEVSEQTSEGLLHLSELVPILYLSTGGSTTSTSTTTIWEQEKRYQQQFDRDLDVDHKLPPAKDNWAVVISPSTTWSNYRHQADAFAMYQTLRHHGYDEDHIVLIVEDNLYNNPNNKLLGQIFVERSDDPNVYDAFINDNVRNHAVVDYHFSQLEPQDVVDIMLGRQSDRLPHVIHPDSTSNVFFFWSGHGGSYDGPLWGNENAREYFGSKRLKDMVAQMDAANMYRRLMFCIETCYSGIWGEALEGFPDVLALTAANSIESSKADVHDSYLGVFLSNAFSRTFRRTVYNEPDIAIHDLYKDLAKTTNGSHVSIYNESNYGSVFTNTMGDYLPE